MTIFVIGTVGLEEPALQRLGLESRHWGKLPPQAGHDFTDSMDTWRFR